MNLIEKLGGYENAKERFKRENVLSDSDFDYGQAKLLEYRRTHNIFEFGDEVVSRNGSDNLFNVCFIGGGLARLKSINFDHVYPLMDFRHATPQEIKTGKRGGE